MSLIRISLSVFLLLTPLAGWPTAAQTTAQTRVATTVYVGTADNKTARLQAKVTLRVERDGNQVRALMQTAPPLQGSGWMYGTCEGENCRMSGRLNEGVDIEFTGRLTATEFRAEYVVSGANMRNQYGTYVGAVENPPVSGPKRPPLPAVAPDFTGAWTVSDDSSILRGSPARFTASRVVLEKTDLADGYFLFKWAGAVGAEKAFFKLSDRSFFILTTRTVNGRPTRVRYSGNYDVNENGELILEGIGAPTSVPENRRSAEGWRFSAIARKAATPRR